MVNLNRVDISHWLKDPRNVYIGAKNYQFGLVADSKWVNRFDGDGDLSTSEKEEALVHYEEFITGDDTLSSSLGELRDKILGCLCLDEQYCHGNILLKTIGAQ